LFAEDAKLDFVSKTELRFSEFHLASLLVIEIIHKKCTERATELETARARRRDRQTNRQSL